MLQNYYPAASELEIRRQLGSGFAESVLALEPGQWHGPVLSGYGVHLVYVYEFQKAPAPLFADVEEPVLQNWQAEQQEAFNAEFYESLKKLYDIEIAAVPAELILNSDADAPGEDQTATGTEPAS
jgi:hypothetical protein